MATQIDVTTEMAQALADQYGGISERSSKVGSVGFCDDEETGNVMTAFAMDGTPLFQFAWRPHKPSPESNNYTDEGLFIC